MRKSCAKLQHRITCRARGQGRGGRRASASGERARKCGRVDEWGGWARGAAIWPSTFAARLASARRERERDAPIAFEMQSKVVEQCCVVVHARKPSGARRFGNETTAMVVAAKAVVNEERQRQR